MHQNQQLNASIGSGDRFRLFVDAVKDYAIYTLDPEGYVTHWNQGAERIHGFTAAQIVGQHFSAFFTAADREDGKPEQELRIASREGRFEAEGWRVRQGGGQFWANVVLTAIKDEDGAVLGFAKVTRDFTERMRADESLRRSNAELAAEIKERKSAEAKLASSERSLRQLSLHLLHSQDEERRRIGRELHDSLGQYLAVLKISLDSMHALVKDTPITQALDECLRLADESIKEVRTISYLLYPPMLEEVGLVSAIPWYLEGFSKRSKIQTTFDVDPEFGRLDRDVELSLFRVLQEGLTNVHRHSGSATAHVRLSLGPEQAFLEIQDRGKGIPREYLEKAGEDWVGSTGVGLRGMNERLRQLGGVIHISADENGTTVRASVPVANRIAA